MGLRINQNIASLRVQANLAKVSGRLEQSLERLSSGLRINRAADDAAGLAISEKLRSQVRGLTRARLNAEDGISLLQVAEGALNETHSNLQRMRELALQASNDTLTASDRLELQKEIDELKDDIDRIANNTEFNTKKLLDGSQSAIVSSSVEGTGARVTGVTENLADYQVSVFQKTAGTKQLQSSNIFTLNGATSLAVSTTLLESVAQFYDNNGNFILADPQTLTMLGNKNQTAFNITKDMTLGTLATKIQDAMSSGLDITNSSSAFQSSGTSQGTIQVQSGFTGQNGEITYAASESVLVALGFGVKQAAVDSVISVKATNIASGTVTTGTTTQDNIANIVQGVDVVIGTPTSANLTASVTAVDGISIGAQIKFSIYDTLGTLSLNAAQGTLVTLNAGRYTLQQIVDDINWALNNNGAHASGAVVGTHQASGGASVKAVLDSGNRITFQLTGTKAAQSGSAAVISVKANAASGTYLGIISGATTGSGGTEASVIGNLSGTDFAYDFATNDVSIFIRDGHGDSIKVVLGTDHQLIADQETALNTIVASINSQIGAAVKVQAYATSDGRLAFASTEAGDAASIRISFDGAAAPEVSVLGYSNTAFSDTGTGGVDPEASYTITASLIEKGYALQRDTIVVGDKLDFKLENEKGESGTLNYTAAQTYDTIAFQSDIVSLINNDSTVGAFAEANFNTITNKLEITSKTLGQDGWLKITDTTGGATDTNTVGSVFGYNTGEMVKNGSGAQSFNLHIVSKLSKLTVGANIGQAIDLGIRNVNSDSLGVSGLDVTNTTNASRALRAIDKAIDIVSSSRASMGALENRLSVAIKNLDNAATNLSSAESRIRDLDIASQIVDFTRDQILTQAGTAILAQANTQPQSVLQLLG